MKLGNSLRVYEHIRYESQKAGAAVPGNSNSFLFDAISVALNTWCSRRRCSHRAVKVRQVQLPQMLLVDGKLPQM